MPNKRRHCYSGYLLLFLLFMFLQVESLFGASGRVPPKSARRQKRISKIIKNYSKADEDLNDPDVQDAIFKDVEEFYVLEPKTPANKMDTSTLAKKVRKIVAKRFPESSKRIRSHAETDANKKFKLVPPMSKVTVQYQRGDQRFQAKGTYYGYGLGGKSIKVGSRIIAIFDLLPRDRVKFDRAFCKQKKKEYIDQTIRKYYTKKNLYSLDTYSKLKKAQIQENEKAGYIFMANEWRSPKEVTELLLMTYGARKRKKEKKKEKAIKVVATDIPDETNGKTENKGKKKKLTQEEFTKKAEKMLYERRQKFAGIDADHGYHLAQFGMTHKEVNILFNRPYDIKALANPEIIEYESGPIKDVELHFFHNTFYKVIIHFRIAAQAAMEEIFNQLNDRYGLTDEQKALKNKPKEGPTDENENAEEKKEGEEEKKKGEEEKKEGEEAPPPIPLKQIFHWTGEDTIGVMTIKINKARTEYTEFTLMKENPNLKKQILTKLQIEKQKREAEARKKELEQYKKKIKF